MAGFRSALIFGAAGVLCAAANGVAPGKGDAPARPVVVLVHGSGELDSDTSDARAEWLDALAAGTRALGVTSPFRPEDVRLVWYADVLDPLSEERCDRRPAPSGSQSAPRSETGYQLDLSPTAFLASLVELVPDEGRQVARGLLGGLLYLGDAGKRCAAERRLGNVLDGAARERRPVILVAHSFGSFVAYGYLHDYRPRPGAPAVDVHRLVTIGSMLGAPEVRRLLLRDPGAARVPSPRGVRSWVNVRAAGDPFSFPLAGAVDSASGQMRLEDVTTTRRVPTMESHAIATYLRDPATARAIVAGWCEAFEPARGESKPEGCKLQ